jgi:hypothetical protein
MEKSIKSNQMQIQTFLKEKKSDLDLLDRSDGLMCDSSDLNLMVKNGVMD